MGEESVEGKSGIVGEWVIKDREGNVIDRGTGIPTPEKGDEEGK